MEESAPNPLNAYDDIFATGGARPAPRAAAPSPYTPPVFNAQTFTTTAAQQPVPQPSYIPYQPPTVPVQPAAPAPQPEVPAQPPAAEKDDLEIPAYLRRKR